MTITSQREQRIDPIAREQQRVEHLVLGRARPAPVIGPKPKGLSKAEWRVRKEALRARGGELLPGVEESVQLIETYGGKQGTPETLAKFDQRHRRSGAIARLYASRAIDADQLAAADSIATAYRAVTADAPLRTASWETRTATSGGPGGHDWLLFSRTLDDLAMEWWLASIQQPHAMVAIIACDLGLTIAAKRYALSVPRTRDLVRAALTTWFNRFGRAAVAGD